MSKSKNTNTKKDKATKSRQQQLYLEDYLDCFTFKMSPVTQKFIDRIAGDLLDWAHNDETAINFGEFYTKKRIPRRTFDGWVKKYEPLTSAYAMAKEILASRRDKGAAYNRMNANYIKFTMPNYDDSFIDMAKKWEQTKEQEPNQTKVVIIEKFKEPKKDEDEGV